MSNFSASVVSLCEGEVMYMCVCVCVCVCVYTGCRGPVWWAHCKGEEVQNGTDHQSPCSQLLGGQRHINYQLGNWRTQEIFCSGVLGNLVLQGALGHPGNIL